MKNILISLITILSLSSCKSWSDFKSDSADTWEKTKVHTKNVYEGSKRAGKKAVDKTRNAFGTKDQGKEESVSEEN